METVPTGNHPESIDPPWFQDLVERAFSRTMLKLVKQGYSMDEAVERAMWHVFELRNNLTDLYHEGSGEG